MAVEQTDFEMCLSGLPTADDQVIEGLGELFIAFHKISGYYATDFLAPCDKLKELYAAMHKDEAIDPKRYFSVFRMIFHDRMISFVEGDMIKIIARRLQPLT